MKNTWSKMLEEYTDNEIIDEVKRRIKLYKAIGEIEFYYNKEQEILAVEIVDDYHHTANKGDLWVLNKSYALTKVKRANNYISSETGFNEYIIFEKMKGNEVTGKLSIEYQEYIGESFMQALEGV